MISQGKEDFVAYLIPGKNNRKKNPGKNRLHISLFICVNPPAKYCIQRFSETTVHLLVFLICVHILLEAIAHSTCAQQNTRNNKSTNDCNF